MAKQEKKSQPKSKEDTSFQKMIKASKEAKDRLVFDKTKVNK